MTEQTARLHAGLIAKKGQARPASLPVSNLASQLGTSRTIEFADATAMRRAPSPVQPVGNGSCTRIIELPRQHLCDTLRNKSCRRHQIHARVSPDIHFHLKMTAAQLNRTQQGLVASALESYLSFIDCEVLPIKRDGRNARN